MLKVSRRSSENGAVPARQARLCEGESSHRAQHLLKVYSDVCGGRGSSRGPRPVTWPRCPSSSSARAPSGAVAAWCGAYRATVERASAAFPFGTLDARLVRACAPRARPTRGGLGSAQRARGASRRENELATAAGGCSCRRAARRAGRRAPAAAARAQRPAVPLRRGRSSSWLRAGAGDNERAARAARAGRRRRSARGRRRGLAPTAAPPPAARERERRLRCSRCRACSSSARRRAARRSCASSSATRACTRTRARGATGARRARSRPAARARPTRASSTCARRLRSPPPRSAPRARAGRARARRVPARRRRAQRERGRRRVARGRRARARLLRRDAGVPSRGAARASTFRGRARILPENLPRRRQDLRLRRLARAQAARCAAVGASSRCCASPPRATPRRGAWRCRARADGARPVPRLPRGRRGGAARAPRRGRERRPRGEEDAAAAEHAAAAERTRRPPPAPPRAVAAVAATIGARRAGRRQRALDGRARRVRVRASPSGSSTSRAARCSRFLPRSSSRTRRASRARRLSPGSAPAPATSAKLLDHDGGRARRSPRIRGGGLVQPPEPPSSARTTRPQGAQLDALLGAGARFAAAWAEPRADAAATSGRGGGGARRVCGRARNARFIARCARGLISLLRRARGPRARGGGVSEEHATVSAAAIGSRIVVATPSYSRGSCDSAPPCPRQLLRRVRGAAPLSFIASARGRVRAEERAARACVEEHRIDPERVRNEKDGCAAARALRRGGASQPAATLALSDISHVWYSRFRSSYASRRTPLTCIAVARRSLCPRPCSRCRRAAKVALPRRNKEGARRSGVERTPAPVHPIRRPPRPSPASRRRSRRRDWRPAGPACGRAADAAQLRDWWPRRLASGPACRRSGIAAGNAAGNALEEQMAAAEKRRRRPRPPGSGREARRRRWRRPCAPAASTGADGDALRRRAEKLDAASAGAARVAAAAAMPAEGRGGGGRRGGGGPTAARQSRARCSGTRTCIPALAAGAEVRACQTCAATFGNVTQRHHAATAAAGACQKLVVLARPLRDPSWTVDDSFASSGARRPRVGRRRAAEDSLEQTMRELRTGQPDQVAKIFGRAPARRSPAAAGSPRQRHASSSTSSVRSRASVRSKLGLRSQIIRGLPPFEFATRSLCDPLLHPQAADGRRGRGLRRRPRPRRRPRRRRRRLSTSAARTALAGGLKL